MQDVALTPRSRNLFPIALPRNRRRRMEKRERRRRTGGGIFILRLGAWAAADAAPVARTGVRGPAA